MKIAVVGTGYVGLVTGTCFADSGNTVTCLDINAEKIARLNRGEIPIYEPGLEELVVRNAKAGRLKFSTDSASGVRSAQVIFLAVGTPPSADGSADLSALWKVVDSIAPHLDPQAVVVTKSTVPVGTNAKVAERLAAKGCSHVDVASNPEFLREGTALDDFLAPDRVVVGCDDRSAALAVADLYAALGTKTVITNPETSETIKYAANAFLAMKLSFINDIAALCEAVGAS